MTIKSHSNSLYILYPKLFKYNVSVNVWTEINISQIVIRCIVISPKLQIYVGLVPSSLAYHTHTHTHTHTLFRLNCGGAG